MSDGSETGRSIEMGFISEKRLGKKQATHIVHDGASKLWMRNVDRRRATLFEDLRLMRASIKSLIPNVKAMPCSERSVTSVARNRTPCGW